MTNTAYNQAHPLRTDFLDLYWLEQWIAAGLTEFHGYLSKYDKFYIYLRETNRL